jgi:hypothetical protein
LPAPLGPMTPSRRPGYRLTSSALTACRPPKRLYRPRAARIGSLTAGTASRCPGARTVGCGRRRSGS